MNTATGVIKTTMTNASGDYQAIDLQIGRYQVTAVHAGFNPLTSQEYKLEINQSERIDFKLTVAGSTQTVTVGVQAAQIDTVTSTVGYSVTGAAITEMPLNGRDPLDLAELQPGVTNANNPGSVNDGTNHQSIAGGRSDSVGYLLDGGVNNNLLFNAVVFTPNPDAVEEFRILQSDYSAEYGRNGGGQISIVTKSGTDRLHGSLFDYARNEAFDANRFYNKRANPIIPRDILKRQQYGGTVGGPIVFPKLVNGKDRFFFFFAYQGQKETQTANNGGQQVYTTAELNGDFSAPGADPNGAVAAFLQAHPYYQANPQLAVAGIIDPTRIDPVTTAYIAKNYIPSTPNGFLLSTGTATDNYNQYHGRFDFHITNSDLLTTTLAYQNERTLSPFEGSTIPFPVTNQNRTSYLAITYTRTFTAHLLNELRIVAQRANNLTYQPVGNPGGPSTLGIEITPDDTTGPTIIDFTSFVFSVGYSGQGPTSFINNTFQYGDSLSSIKGKHLMKYGVGFSPYHNNTNFDYFVNGGFFFYGNFQPGSSVASGNPYADLLFGAPDSLYQGAGALSSIRTTSYFAYAQDRYKATSRLTFNYGLRYEYNSPRRDTQGRTFSLIPGEQSTRFVNAPVGLVFPGDRGAPEGVNFPDHTNWAPRFGFALDPAGDGKTSIRGGVGIFYDILSGDANLQFNGLPPFYSADFLSYAAVPGGQTSALNYLSNPYVATGTINPFPSKPPTSTVSFAPYLPFGSSAQYFVRSHLKTPHIDQYNLDIQRVLPQGMALDLAYVGNISHGLTATVDYNPYVLGTYNMRYSLLNGYAPGNNSAYSWLDTFDNVTYANYNSLQVRLTKHLTEVSVVGPMAFTFAYTHSKNLDNVSGFRERNYQVPYYNRRQFYADSDTDVPNNVVFSGTWYVPFDKWIESSPKVITKGWRVSPIFTWRSGFPLDVLAGLTRNLGNDPGPSGAGDQELVRADLVGTKVTTQNPYHEVGPDGVGSIYFQQANFSNARLQNLENAALVTPPTSGYTYGTLPRNFFRGPTRANTDVEVAKQFSMANDKIQGQFIVDFFNIFNSAQFGAPNWSIGSSTFGEITTTYDPRIIQLAVRITF